MLRGGLGRAIFCFDSCCLFPPSAQVENRLPSPGQTLVEGAVSSGGIGVDGATSVGARLGS